MKSIKQLLFTFFISCFLLLGKAQAQQNSPWHITATNSTDYVGIALANGRIGLMPSEKPLEVKSLILNHVFDKESPLGVSKLLLGINFANLELQIDGEKVDESNTSKWKQVLDMKAACLNTSIQFKEIARVEYSTRALRGMPYGGLIDVNITPLKKDIKIKVLGKIICPSEYTDQISTFRILRDLEARMPLLQTVAKSPYGKHTLAATASFIFDHEFPEFKHQIDNEFQHALSFERELAKGKTYNFAWTGAICTTQDFNDPQSESERMVIFNLRGNKDAMIAKHQQLWNKLWQGDIEIEGDLESQRDVRLALYHLYSFSREDSNLSISPMGLSSLGYNGHVFWDTELWMYPPLLVFNQGIAKSLLNYRSNRLDKAIQKAQNFGYKGAMFPWESDESGEEATPTWALTGTFEHHITADVGIAFWNYYRVSKDKAWLTETGYPMLKEVADFWVSRSLKNADGSYSIKNVVGANEFAPNVDDNAFTNGSAKTVLEYAYLAAIELGITPNKQWKEVADHLKFNFFEDGTMMEHTSYDGAIIKQADVNLLAYPLSVVSKKEAIEKDLEYYEPKMAAEGPAMSHSVLSILHARLGDKKKAFDLFKRAYEPNKRAPFGALAESAMSHNPYFATGAGGMLQSVIFGFAGLHITKDGIVQKDPCLPKQWKKLTIKGVGPQKQTYVVD